jgi:site-specific recombinase XerD
LSLGKLEVNTSSESLKPHFQKRVQKLLQKAIPHNTLQAYKSDWQHFQNWCQRNSLKSLPASPSTVAYFITDISDDYKISTIERRVATISKIHKISDVESPCSDPKVREVLKALRRTMGTKKRKVKPLLSPQIKKICRELGSKLIDHRDRALLLLGFAGGFRRSELISLNVEDIEKNDKGLVITLRSSKTDQEGVGREIGICYGSDPLSCPVRAYSKWIQKSGIEGGMIFPTMDRHGNIKENRLSGQSIALIVKKMVSQLGLTPDQYSGHSLRAGFVTTAFVNGASTVAVKNQTGHRTDSVLMEYYRPSTLFVNNASSLLNL